MRAQHFFLFLFFVFLFSTCDKDPTKTEFKQFTWEISTPAAQGMNPSFLDSAFTLANSLGFVDALLVVRNGAVVQEKYFNGYNEKSPHNVMSVSKSFLSALTGVALHKGFVDSLDEKMLNYFPEYIYTGIDKRKYGISIRHLLSMRMGIDGEASNNYANYMSVYRSDNWIKTTIELPLLFNPGEKMRYNTFQTHLLSAILTKASQKSTLELARALLTDPLGITIHDWEQDPQGYYFGGNSMFFTPREMAVLGCLYLNGGRLNDEQIVPQDWVEFTLTPSTDNMPNQWGAWKNYNYAYLWWLGEMNNYHNFMAYGYGGQFIICFPELNLIVVSTANNNVDPDASTVQEWAIFDLVADYILPAIKKL